MAFALYGELLLYFCVVLIDDRDCSYRRKFGNYPVQISYYTPPPTNLGGGGGVITALGQADLVNDLIIKLASLQARHSGT